MGTVFAPSRFSSVRISIRDLVAKGKSSVRNSGVQGGMEKDGFASHCYMMVRDRRIVVAVALWGTCVYISIYAVELKIGPIFAFL